jgi:hypothetical protein
MDCCLRFSIAPIHRAGNKDTLSVLLFNRFLPVSSQGPVPTAVDREVELII